MGEPPCPSLAINTPPPLQLIAYSGGRGALAHPGVRTAMQWLVLLILPFFPAKSEFMISEWAHGP